MKLRITYLLVLVALNAAAVSSTTFASSSYTSMGTPLHVLNEVEDIKEEAFKILETKCNACHRKKNPFIVFKRKNMVRRASKIHRLVFIERRMPKGDEIRLSDEESQKLKLWLSSQKIN